MFHLKPSKVAPHTASTAHSSHIKPETIDISRSNKCSPRKVTYALDVLLSAFVFTPLAIFYWTSTWDIIFFYIFPDDFFLSCAVTLLLSYTILIGAYMFQSELQAFHDRLRHKRLSQSAPASQRAGFYAADFYLRCAFTYALTVAYVAQWRAFWDFYNHFAQHSPWQIFLALACVSLLCYRYLLGHSFSNYTKTVPYYFVPDVSVDAYFMQAKFIELKNNKRTETVLNFVYTEVIEMLLATYAWKGIWDLCDLGVLGMLADDLPYRIEYSFLITFAFGYCVFFAILLHQSYTMSSRVYKAMGKRTRALLEDAVYIVAYVSISSIWRTFWNGYDHFVLDLQHKELIVIATHFATLIILCYSKAATCLYGPAGGESSSSSFSSSSAPEECQRAVSRDQFRNLAGNRGGVNAAADTVATVSNPTATIVAPVHDAVIALDMNENAVDRLVTAFSAKLTCCLSESRVKQAELNSNSCCDNVMFEINYIGLF